VVKKIKILLTERSSRTNMKRRLLVQQRDYKLIKSVNLDKDLTKLNKQLIKNITAQIKVIEIQIEELIKEDEKLSNHSKLIKTEVFTATIDPRKMHCYSGVFPFENQSETSICKRPRVAPFTDKAVKSILHLAAMSAIRLDNELRVYYLRKAEHGKNKMSVLNAVRNKITHRVFAVMKNQTQYQNRLVLS
jgi:transposase